MINPVPASGFCRLPLYQRSKPPRTKQPARASRSIPHFGATLGKLKNSAVSRTHGKIYSVTSGLSFTGRAMALNALRAPTYLKWCFKFQELNKQLPTAKGLPLRCSALDGAASKAAESPSMEQRFVATSGVLTVRPVRPG